MTLNLARLGPFVLEEVIGSGGMGEVWRGMHQARAMPVAVKILRGEIARKPAYRRAFSSEVRAVARLQHPHIVTVFDHGEVSEAEAEGLASRGVGAGSPWLAMELCGGEPLMRFRGRLSWEELYGMLLALLDALAHAHARGLVHRDLKPGNALFGGEALKLLDFGLAVIPDEERPGGPKAVFGTAPYMAPEQFWGDPQLCGPYTDLYALGALAWTLACGEPPFGLKSDFQTLREAHLHGALPSFEPRVLLPDGFEPWVRRLLEKEPQRRFQRAADAAWALRGLAPTRARVSPIEGGLDLPTLSWSETPTTPAEPKGALGDEPLTLSDDALVELDRPPTPLDWRRPEVTPRRGLAASGLGLFGLREIPLVDREWERDQLWRALLRAESGQPTVALLQGPAGNGKSRLARWLCERAHELGAAEVVSATHSPQGGPTDGVIYGLGRHLRCVEHPHSLVIRRVRDALRRQGNESERQAQALAELIRPATEEELRAGLVAVRLGSRKERFDLLAGFFAGLARARPLILRLEDVQWGHTSLAFALSLIETQPDAPILLLMTAREVPPESAEGRLLAQLLGTPGAARVPLGPLAPGYRAELVQQLLDLDGELARQVDQRSAGNPLFVVQLVGDWVQRGLLEPGPGGFRLRPEAQASLPDDLHGLWSARVEGLLKTLDPTEERALEIAATLGVTVTPDEWRDACHLGGAWASHRLVDALLGAGLAEPDPDGAESGWSFVHVWLRESLLRRAEEAGRLAEHHRACAAMLSARPRRGASLELRLGRHLNAVGDHEGCLGPLARGAWGSVIDSEYLEAENALAERERAVEALGLAEGDPRRGEGALMRARVARRLGDHAACARYASLAERSARAAGGGALLSQALRERARVADHVGDRRLALRLLTEAEAVADAAGDELAVAWCRRDRARELLAEGQLAEAEALFGVAATVFERAHEVFGLGNCLEGLATARSLAGDAEECLALCGLAEEAYHQSMQVQEIAHSLVGLGSLAALRGRHEEALGLFERALDRLRAIGSAATDEARLGLARALAARGRVKAAERMMTELAEEHRAAGRPGWWARAEAERARLAAERAQFDEAQDALVSCAEGLNAVHLSDAALAAAASRVAELGRAAGDAAVVELAARIAEVTSAEHPAGRVPVLG